MDNPTRSEQSRLKAIKAALGLLQREGIGALTFDALASESGISKGGLLHQFETKEGLLTALLQYRSQHINEVATDLATQTGTPEGEPALQGQLKALQALASATGKPVNLAFLAALAQAPELLQQIRSDHTEYLTRIHDEAQDADLAALRWLAATGLVLMDLLGFVPLAEDTSDTLFERLRDPAAWRADQNT
ncbi:AcrR family transcriptional regulator [Silvimonas terrae]|uniref:AcrR family transcriptional regulator n=1 Tax=Silvimonas terrae TaxID=300266 RepID=A0A840RCN1_9NEIS|nr:TetR/AcrR family transcriptional regulator [Silvimonas terrae]MBB5190133.1 AcrR family transcriptional regulator [Silvimonas terrae]